MPSWFITGTDTEVGKTLFTGLFGKFLTQYTNSVVTQKWVQTGTLDYPLDIETHDKVIQTSLKISSTITKYRMPYSFKLPASAHLAAEQEKEVINPHKISQTLRYLEKEFDIVLMEGLGGIHVPLTSQITTLDLLEQLKTHTIVIVPNQIGAINHALLTIEAIANRQIPLSGFIINNMNPSTPELIKKDNPAIIEAFSGISCIGTINSDKSLILNPSFIANELELLTQ